MGKISSSEPQQKETTATHFSHPHPLKLINYNYQNHNASPCCSGCKLKPSGAVYSCTLCSYVLHKSCFEMPKTISHPFHKEHSFTLLLAPAYAEGIFNCDACAETGDGFSYHCKPCGIDLHILCAATPLTLTTVYHPHKLDLAFGSPYHTKNFGCDVCTLQGSDHWLYRCNSCGFDAHLKCAKDAPSQPQAGSTGSRSIHVPQPQGHGVPSFGMGAPPPRQHGFVAPNNMMNMNPGIGLGVNNAQNGALLQSIQQIMQNPNPMTQALVSGGSSAVGNICVQQLMQLMSNGGIPGGLNAFGGGGGGGLDSLQLLLGGGGGGLSSLQSLLGGGGGGGLDSLQSLLGGGVGGGLDSLQSLLGGGVGGGLDLLGGLL